MAKVFISYSHKDEDWKDRIVRQLDVLSAAGLEVWDDRRIAGGDDWLPEITTAIEACDVAVLLISAHFLTSKFIVEQEVPALLQRREKEGLRVMPVILSPCQWARVGWLKPIQARPKDGKELSGMTPHDAETALSNLAGEIHDDLAGLQPLYQAVAHGCLAGLSQQASDEVYVERILRGTRHDGFYSTKNLGAFGTDLGAVACFFTEPWRRPAPALNDGDRAWLLSMAAFNLRALGRLEEALEPMRAGAEMRVVQKEQGEFTAAMDRFVEAEAMQAQAQPEYPRLYSLQGFRYCDLLAAEAERAAWTGTREAALAERCMEVAARAAQTLKWIKPQAWLLDNALDHLTLARCALYATKLQGQAPSADDCGEIERAVTSLRAAGQQQYIPRGLLTRAWLRHSLDDLPGAEADLNEAQQIAARGGMKLHLADIALTRARLFQDRAALGEARRLIEECGYGRRLPELVDAEAAALTWPESVSPSPTPSERIAA